MNSICVVSIDFEEGRPDETYQGVRVYGGPEELPRTWASGDFIKDWNAAVSFADRNYFIVQCSSTVDTFFRESTQYALDHADNPPSPPAAVRK